MSTEILDKHIEITPGVCSGKPRIAGRRITVQSIAIWHERLGLSADEIASEHELTLGGVYAALAYYFDHQAEIDCLIQDEEAFVAELRDRTPSPLDRKLAGLRGGKRSGEAEGPNQK